MFPKNVLFLPIFCQVVEGGEMESESHEEAGDEEIESGAAGNESDMDLDLLAESDSDSEESQVQLNSTISTWFPT